ncbi:hypothetical protein BFP76_02360 [Amylibacter kogurei]|uniref:Uncharacterized protein n=1 Tax=Paramylibacter kogurei TaxID=1889778 RepID=A0A2G5K512_9RHOB|nr:hypothetical protein [Amylibacter kogurei]PIB24103.1 hypothetical protein BFP76_02360 [Amylibacter kogurei]
MLNINNSITHTVSFKSQKLAISQSTRTAGSTFDSTHFLLTIHGESDFHSLPVEMRFAYQDFGNPSHPPSIKFISSGGSGNTFYVEQFVDLEFLNAVQSGVSDSVISHARVTFFGDEFSKNPKNGFEQRELAQIIFN